MVEGRCFMKYTNSFGNNYEIKFIIDMYSVDKSTYIAAVVMEDGEVVDCYADITRCIPFATQGIILDTNNVPDLCDAMVEQGLIVKTGEEVTSGSCTYPIAKVTDKFYTECLNGCIW